MNTTAQIKHAIAVLETLETVTVFGRVIEVRENVIKAVLQTAQLGYVCEIERDGGAPLRARVVALVDHYVVLSPFDHPKGIALGARLKVVDKDLRVKISDDLLGRALNAFLEPIDNGGAFQNPMEAFPLDAAPRPAMDRPIISDVFSTGVRAIDGLATLGIGQRIGIFGPPGTGKTSLMSMLAQNCEADVVVICLVGERGREVREFCDEVLTSKSKRRVVVIAATSERPPLERAICAATASTVAEYFQRKGKKVFLLVDSLTRTARALREIGLAAGEAPTRRGYPASVYPALPSLIERAGRAKKGDITAIYTVLTEGEIDEDPIAEEVKSLTDGHLLLNPDLAGKGHYPAIDITKSLSRSMNRIASKQHLKHAENVRKILAKYAEIEMLIHVGEYQKGSDPDGDLAIQNYPKIEAFLTQKPDDVTQFRRSVRTLGEIFDEQS